MATPLAPEHATQLLDRALQQHETARNAFSRDLAIAAIVILVFQFGVFFRFAYWSDRERVMNSQLAEQEADATAVQLIDTQLTSIAKTLKDGTEAFRKVIVDKPAQLRQKLTWMFGQLDDLNQDRAAKPEEIFERTTQRSNRPLENARAPNIAVQAAPDSNQSATPLPAWWVGLTDPERQMLREGRYGPELDQLIEKIVKQQYIAPVYTELAAEKVRLLETPLRQARETLVKLLEDSKESLTRREISPKVFLEPIDTDLREIEKLPLEPPEVLGWWKTRETKEGVFKDLGSQSFKALEQLQQKLDSPKKTLGAASTKLADLKKQAEESSRVLKAAMAEMQASSKVVQGALEILAKPLAAIALDVKPLVIHEPVLVAVLLLIFVIRARLLRRRAGELAKACQELGYPSDLVNLYFGGDWHGAPAFDSRAESRVSFLAWLARPAVLLALLAAVLVVVSIARVWISPTLSPDAPVALYLFAIGCVVVGLGLLMERWTTTPPRTVTENA